MSLPGTMGKILFVDLTTGATTVETPSDQFYLDYMGGYGFGAYYLYKRQKPGVDPLGPDNTLGILPGILTGIHGINCNRFTVVAKSPKTGTWGDANCGGDFGPGHRRVGLEARIVHRHDDAGDQGHQDHRHRPLEVVRVPHVTPSRRHLARRVEKGVDNLKKRIELLQLPPFMEVGRDAVEQAS